MLDQVDSFSAGRVPIAALRADIAGRQADAAAGPGPSEGASEVLLDLATAMNRGGGEAFVRLYLQYALALKPDSDVVCCSSPPSPSSRSDGEEAIALYRQIPADLAAEAGGRPAARPEPCRSRAPRRGDRAAEEACSTQQPDDMRAYLALGGVYASKEDFRSRPTSTTARSAACRSRPPQNWNIFYQRGIAYERLKEWPKAEPNFRKALELFPDQPQVMNYLGYSWVDMNMNLDEGLDADPEGRRSAGPSDGYIVDLLGWAYFRLGKFDDAVRELERAVSLKPDDPVLNDHLGDAYWRDGRKLEATFQWAHARDMKPDQDVLAERAEEAGARPAAGRAAGGRSAGQGGTGRAAAGAGAGRSGKRTEVGKPTTAAVPAAYKVLPGQSLWSIAVDQARQRQALSRDPRPQSAAAARPRPHRARAGAAVAGPGRLSGPPPGLPDRAVADVCSGSAHLRVGAPL